MSNQTLKDIATLINTLLSNRDQFQNTERNKLTKRLEHVYSQLANFGLLEQLLLELNQILTAFLARQLELINQAELLLIEKLQNSPRLELHATLTMSPRPTPGGANKGRREE